MKLIQKKFSLIQFLFILLISLFSTLQNEIQFQYQTSFIPNNSMDLSWFGQSVSISNDGNIALIGAPSANDHDGQAYIFQKNGNGNEWNQIQILTASDGVEGAFGSSVSVSNDGNIILIGAPFADVVNNSGQGKAYIFQKNENETIWNQSQILTSNDGEEFDYFGATVSISNDGNIALIGAYQASVGNSYQQGKAYIFQKNGNETIWNQSQILVASDGKEDDHFGYSVSISNDGNVALIGASNANVGNNTWQGKAYIFQKNGNETIWNQSQILVASDGQANDEFGSSVSISNDGNIILIGAIGAKIGNNTIQGKAYIFQKNGNETIWNQSQILIANDGQANDRFGWSVSISIDGNIALIGASSGKVGNNSYQGKAYIFQKNGNETIWNQSQILIANDGEAGDQFGYSVFLSGNYPIIGAPCHDSYNGEAYLFGPPTPTPTPQPTTSSSSSNSKTTIIVCSTVIPVIVIIGIILAIFFIKKKKRNQNQQNSNDYSKLAD